METNVSASNDWDFEANVKKSFDFLETEFGLTFSGLKEIDSGAPKDSGVVAKYRSDEMRIEIGWSEAEDSLAILLRLENAELTKKEKYIYFEPFVEFISDGAICPIVPQIYHGMSVAKIAKAMEQREKLFAKGVRNVLGLLAKRLHSRIPEIQSATIDVIRKYHRWYGKRGRD